MLFVLVFVIFARSGWDCLFSAVILWVITQEGKKTKENFKLLALKVVAVAYERWSLTRGSKHSDLAGKLSVFWKTGH